MKAVLPRAVRAFVPKDANNSWQLRRAEFMIPDGATVDIGPVSTKIYDHREQLVVSVRYDNRDFFVIVDEMGSLNSKV